MSNLAKTFSDLSAEQRKLLEEKVPTLFNALKAAGAPPPPPAKAAAPPPPPPAAAAAAVAKTESEETCIQVPDYQGVNNTKEVIDVFIVTTYTIATDVLVAQKLAEHLRTKEKDDKKPLVVCLLSETQASVGLGIQMLEKAAVTLLCISKKGLLKMAQEVESGESRILLEIEHTLKSFAAGGKLLYSLMIDNDDNTPFGMFDTKIYPQIKHKSTKSLFAKENKTIPDTMNALFKLNGRPVSLELYQDRTPEILFKIKEADKKGIHRQIAKKLRLAKASARPMGPPKVLTSGENAITIYDVALGNVDRTIEIGETALNVLVSDDAKYIRVATEQKFHWVNLISGEIEASVDRLYPGEVHMINTEVCYVLQENAIVVSSMVTGKGIGKLVLNPNEDSMDQSVQPTEAALAGIIVMITASKQFALWDILDNDGKVDLTGLKEAPKQEGEDLPCFLPGQIIRQVKPLSPEEMAKLKQDKLNEEKAAKTKLAKGDDKKKEEKKAEKGDKKKGAVQPKKLTKKQEMAAIWKRNQEEQQEQSKVLEITNLDISADGKYLAYSTETTPYNTNPLYVIDLEGNVNAFCHILDSHHGPIRGINFSKEGNFLLSVSDDATCKVWALETGELEASLVPTPKLVHSGQDPQFSSDEKFVLILGSPEVNGLQLWNVADKKMVQHFVCGPLFDFALFNTSVEAKVEQKEAKSPAVSENKLAVPEAKEGKTTEKKRASISTHPGADRMVIRAGDSYALVTIAKDGLTKVEIPYPRENLQLEICDPSTLHVYGVTTDGFLQASVLNEKGEVSERWKTNIAQTSKKSDVGNFSAIYLTPSYVLLLSEQTDHYIYSLTGRFLKFVRSDSPVQFFATDDAGQYLAFAEDGPDGKGVLIRKIENTANQWLCLTEDEYDVSAMSFFPDGSMLAVGCHSGTLLLLDSNAGTPVHTFPSRKSPATISWSPSGKYLAVVYKDGASYPKVLIYSSAKRKTVNWGKKNKPADGKEEQDDFIEIKSSRCGLGWSTDDTLLVWAAFGDSPYDENDDGGDEKDYAISAVTVATGEIKEVLKCGSGARYLHRVLPANRNLSSALDPLKIEQEQISVATYDSIWKCKEHNSPYHDIFLNYRVWVNNKQNDLSMRLALHLGKQLKDNGSPVKVFLDRNCLVDGEDWEAGFLYGLAYSTTMVLLISDLVVQGIIDNAPKWQDNVMLEYEAALELYQKNEASVLPLYVDNEDFSPFSKKDPSLYPDAPHVSKLSGKNIRYTMTELFKIPGARISQGRFADRTSTIMDFLRTADAKGHHRIARSKPLFPRGPPETVPGTNVAVARNGAMKVDVFNVESESCLLTLSFDSEVVHLIAPPAANQLFTLTANGRIAKHSLRTGLRQWDVFPTQTDEGTPVDQSSKVVLSPSCKRLCIFTATKLFILETDGTLLTTIASMPDLDFSGAPVFSYDDTFLVVPVRKSIQIWDLRKGVLLRSLNVRGLSVTSIALSFDNSNLACCSEDDTEACMVVVVSLTGKTLYEFANESVVENVRISTVGSYLAAQGPDFVKVWSLDTGDLEGVFNSATSNIQGFLFTPDERHILIQMSATIFQFNFTQGKIERALRSPCQDTIDGALAVCSVAVPRRAAALDIQPGPLPAAPSPQEYGYFNSDDRKYYFWSLKTPEKPEAKPIRLPSSYSGDGDYDKLLAFKTHNGANCLYILGDDAGGTDNLFAFKNSRQDFAATIDTNLIYFTAANMTLEMDGAMLVLLCSDASLICVNANDGKFVKRILPLDREEEESEEVSYDKFSMAAGVPGSFAASCGGLVAFARKKGVVLRGFNTNENEVCYPLLDPSESGPVAQERKDAAGHTMLLTPWAYGAPNGYEAGWNCDICTRSNGDMEGTEGNARYHCPECQSDICMTCAREGITCPNGHSLSTVGPDGNRWPDNGWACDARKHPDGCLRGCTGFGQSTGWPRFRCAECDFDLCDVCCDSFETDAVTLEAAKGVAVSPLGDRVAAIPEVGQSLFLIDPVSHALVKTEAAPDGVEGDCGDFTDGLAISFDGKYVAAQRGAAVCVWNMADGKVLKSFSTEDAFNDIPLRWSSDSTQVYIVTNDDTQTLVAYNALTGEKGVSSPAFVYEDTETYDDEVEAEEEDEEEEDDGVEAGVLCDDGHKLVMGANQDKYQGAAACDVCRASIPPKFAYSCDACSYDLCKKCFIEKFDGTLTDAKGHIYVLGANATKREYASSACCDVCRAEVAASTAYSCSQCNADLCASCYAEKENPDGEEGGEDAEAGDDAEGGGDAEGGDDAEGGEGDEEAEE